MTDKPYGDFVLKAKVKIRNGNSGIQFRSKRTPDGAVSGPQADVADGYWGLLYEERGRGILERYPEEKANALVKKDDWNDFVITAKGDHVTIDFNGTRDHRPHRRHQFAKTGIIALQAHAGPPMEVRFKDIEIKRELTDGPTGLLDCCHPHSCCAGGRLPVLVHWQRPDRLGHRWPGSLVAGASGRRTGGRRGRSRELRLAHDREILHRLCAPVPISSFPGRRQRGRTAGRARRSGGQHMPFQIGLQILDDPNQKQTSADRSLYWSTSVGAFRSSRSTRGAQSDWLLEPDGDRGPWQRRACFRERPGDHKTRLVRLRNPARTGCQV